MKNAKKVLQNSINVISQKATNTTRFCKHVVRRTVFVTVLTSTLTTLAIGTIANKTLPHVHNIYTAAKLVDGESRGESYAGQKASFATLLVRKEHTFFPDTLHAVAFQPYTNNVKLLQYNAMGDHLHEDLSTELGQKILKRTAWWYLQMQMGIFRAPKEALGAHSYCTPKACKEQKAYFGRLCTTGQIGNHVFYGDCKTSATMVSAKNSKLAPKKSLRPKPRPQSSHLQSSIDELIATLID